MFRIWRRQGCVLRLPALVWGFSELWHLSGPWWRRGGKLIVGVAPLSHHMCTGHLPIKAEGRLGSTTHQLGFGQVGLEFRGFCEHFFWHSCFSLLPMKIPCFLQLPALSHPLHTSAGKVTKQTTEEPNSSILEALFAVLSCAGLVRCLGFFHIFLVVPSLAFSSQWLLAKRTFLIAK